MKTLKVTGGVVAALVFAALSGNVFAQEFRALPSGERGIEVLAGREREGLEGSLSIQGRYSVPLGTVDPDLAVDYGDLFKSGLGLSVEGSLLWHIGPKWHLGPYLSVGWDSYEGKSSVDAIGDTLKPDSMDLTSILVGARALLELGPQAQLELHMAFGATLYGKVNGVFTMNGVPLDVIVFDSSSKFAFDIGARFNGVAGPVFFDAGIDIRSQGAPNNADFAFDSGPLVTFGIEFGMGIRF
jgi:hypothetical protein